MLSPSQLGKPQKDERHHPRPTAQEPSCCHTECVNPPPNGRGTVDRLDEGAANCKTPSRGPGEVLWDIRTGLGLPQLLFHGCRTGNPERGRDGRADDQGRQQASGSGL